MSVELEMFRAGKTYSEIAKALNITKGTVAGRIRRAQRPPKPRVIGMRDADAARNQADLADQMGLGVAARMLGMSVSHLCRIRQRVRAERVAGRPVSWNELRGG